MNNQQTQIQSKINEASNILVTVSQNPSIDELTAALGLTLAFDKMRKHSSAIFSGEIPNFMKFLRPERTFEDSVASFRDFIISLDKEKADKLRYKVEGDLVKIFITPYHTKLSPDDLVFSEGELNVDLVIALGVKNKEDLDRAIVGHGRILHDATTITINLAGSGTLGAINWSDIDASSYSEVVANMISGMGGDLLSKQISTALLTGIVLATEQFSNSRTKPATMSVASRLLAAGADQQLIVAEIRGDGAVAETAPEVAHDIPVVDNASSVDIASELEAMPTVLQQDEIDSIKSSLDPYMPPPLPDFSATEAAGDSVIPPASIPEVHGLSDLGPIEPSEETYQETPPEIFPEQPPEPEPAEPATPVPTEPDPRQFVIPS